MNKKNKKKKRKKKEKKNGTTSQQFWTNFEVPSISLEIKTDGRITRSLLDDMCAAPLVLKQTSGTNVSYKFSHNTDIILCGWLGSNVI